MVDITVADAAAAVTAGVPAIAASAAMSLLLFSLPWLLPFGARALALQRELMAAYSSPIFQSLGRLFLGA